MIPNSRVAEFRPFIQYVRDAVDELGAILEANSIQLQLPHLSDGQTWRTVLETAVYGVVQGFTLGMEGDVSDGQVILLACLSGFDPDAVANAVVSTSMDNVRSLMLNDRNPSASYEGRGAHAREFLGLFVTYDASAGTSYAQKARLLFKRVAETAVHASGEPTTPQQRLRLGDFTDQLDSAIQTSKHAVMMAEPRQAPILEGRKSLDEILSELKVLIGLDSVKEDVEELIALLRVQQIRKQRGLPGVILSLHLVFQGNPGTGKTTVARLIAEAYRELGLLSRGHLVETDRSGLVAGYLGQTALRVSEKVQEALGGVLFIDEAYGLVPGDREDPYGAEAITTLVKAMEDRRSELVVIAAGYPEEMKRFLDSNPGLRSRFGKYFRFDDYDPKQLMAIFDGFCQVSGYKLSDGGRSKLATTLNTAFESRDRTFGNARFVRNVFERALERQALRVYRTSTEPSADLSTIEASDFQSADVE